MNTRKLAVHRLAAAAGLMVLGVVPGILCAGEPEKKAEFPYDLDQKHRIGKPAVDGVIAVYPIERNVPAGADAYLTLDEATDAKTIVISEKGSGTVPEVTIINKGTAPIYICAGEVILGGKQDRMISHDVLVKPGAELSVSVRCVEQGRWRAGRGAAGGEAMTFSSGKAMGGRKAKAAVQFKGQSDVWSEVAQQNEQVGAQSRTGSYRAALTDEEVAAAYRKTANTLLPALEGRHVVGMVVAVDGEVHAMELFGSPGLFGKVKDKLLKACVLDIQGVTGSGAAPPDGKQIRAFYEAAAQAAKQPLKAYEQNGNYMRESSDVYQNDSEDGKGAILHRSLLKK
ncbi:MAG: hypothetical protein JXR37_02785 [Kiritimatiellae bacterium]|nr:hypothetical protein [Kiritimatiellia bacterium]